MCKVYNTIGCLTAIRSHLREHNINEYTSLNEIINFQNNYSIAREQIISNHQLLIKEEKNTLGDEIAQLDLSIRTKKNIHEQQLLSQLEKLKHRLDNLSSIHANLIQTIINYVKKIFLKLNIKINELTFNFKIAFSLRHLTKNYKQKNDRYQYIVSDFEGAVTENSFPHLQKLDRTKEVIDQVNNSIYGALGEEKVVSELEKLSDEYILINDFTCKFNRPIYNSQDQSYIRSVQIDHILISPSGIFLIETKNWSQHSLNNTSLYSPVQQIKRTNFVLYKILNGVISKAKLALKKHHWGNRKISIRNLIVLINHKPNEEFQYVKILTVDRLLGYIKYFDTCFSIEETRKIANHLLNISGQ